MSELTRYSAVTPKRPEATCLIAERIESPFGSGLKRSASSPPSPVFDLPPIRFMAMASVVCASREIEPNDIAPVAKRLTMFLAGSTSSSGTGLRSSSSAVLTRNRPRMVTSVSCSLRIFANARYLSCELPRTACCKVETVVAFQTWSSPRTRTAYSPPTSSMPRNTGESPNASRWRRTASSAISSSPTPSIRVAVPVKYLSTNSAFSPTASKICAPQ